MSNIPSPRLLLPAAVLALAGCGPLRTVLPEPGTLLSREPAPVEVAVSEHPATASWDAIYRLPTRAAGVDFVLGRDNRRLAWSAAPAGSTWVDTPDGERLCFAHPTRDLAVAFRDRPPLPRRDDTPTLAMTDGSRLLATGHLVVRPLQTCLPGSAGGQGGSPPHRFRFQTAAGRNVAVGDRVAKDALAWEPAKGAEETYAYFGPAVPIVSERMALILDPALPAWIRSGLEPTIAALLDRFTSETGVALVNRPLMVVALDPRGEIDLFGRASGSAVALLARGEAWLTESAEQRQRWTLALAHQLFALWGSVAYRTDAESGWLAEAAASEFALRAVRRLGVLSERELAERRVDLANRCLAALGGRPVISSPGISGESWSSCGPTLLFVADRGVERARPGEGGLGLLFRGMLAESAASDRSYGTGIFLGWLDKLGADRAAVAALQRLIRRGVPTGEDRFLQQLLSQAGLAVDLVPPEAAAASAAVYDTLLRNGLARCACGAAGEAPGGDCPRFRGEAPLVRVDGVAPTEPAAAYSRLRADARLGRPLRLQLGDDPQPLTLFCGSDALDPSFEQLFRLAPSAAAVTPPPRG